MFEFFLKNRKGEVVNLLDIIGMNLQKMHFARLAEEKAIGMIAKAIAKSEIIITDGHKRICNEIYYRLNIQPNDNQSGTDFWYAAADKLLRTGECIIAIVSKKFYIVTDYTVTDSVLHEKRYYDVTVTDGVDTYRLSRSFAAGDLIICRYESEKIRKYRRMVLQTYNDTLQAVTQLQQIANRPLFKYKYDAMGAFADPKTNKKLTVDEVIDRLKDTITSNDLAIIKEQRGVELQMMELPAKSQTADVKNLADQIDTAAATAYDIPIAVYRGSITEKSDATNEFITYAVQPPVEVLNDSMNAGIVGMEDYIKGERVIVWLAHYKHVDVIDAASALDKLRGIGFNLDEIFELVGWPTLNTEFSTTRFVTKNYSADIGEISTT